MSQSSLGRNSFRVNLWKFFKPVVILVPIIMAGVGVSFLFWGEFSPRAYSDRLFWAGIGTMMVGGFVIWAALGSYRTLGTPSILTAPGDAPIAHERIREHMKMNAGRYTFILRMLLIGGICIAASALVEVLSR